MMSELQLSLMEIKVPRRTTTIRISISCSTKREDELQHSIIELEAKKTELQETTTTDSNQHVAEFQETNADLEMEQEVDMLMNDLSTTPPKYSK